MGFIKTAFFGAVVIYIVTLFINWSPPEAPKLPETWWGPGNRREVDESVKPFRISFEKQVVEDLILRLNKTRPLTPGLENAAWTYGLPGDFMPTIIDYWVNKYDFKKREEHLNKYPQFTTNIQGLDIHFLRVKPTKTKGKYVLPLLIQHGWPGSVLEFYKILPMLTTPRPEHDFVFEVIAPTLPGYGLSDAAVRPGLGSAQMAVVLKNLMLRLGFDKFYAHGGDWGAATTAYMASMFPQHVLGVHSNMCTMLEPWTAFKTVMYGFFPSLILPKEDRHLLYPLSNYLLEMIEESGYFHIQATKPDTIGISLTDSPAGLAAYMLEKFSMATNRANKYRNDGALFDTFTADELIDNIMIYWITGSITSSMRLYAESMTIDYLKLKMESVPIEVPSSCARFPHEVFFYPPSFLKSRYKNLVRSTRMPRGGHFAAMEEPQLLVDDIWASIADMEALRRKK